MKKLMQLLSSVVLFSLIFSQTSSAQLINYERRNRMIKGMPAAVSTSKSSSAVEEKELPKWMKKIPKVNTRTERRYDVNRDSKLQTAEVKVLLRDVIEKVNEKGAYAVTADVLKEYDKNRDGVINRYEVKKIKEDIE